MVVDCTRTAVLSEGVKAADRWVDGMASVTVWVRSVELAATACPCTLPGVPRLPLLRPLPPLCGVLGVPVDTLVGKELWVSVCHLPVTLSSWKDSTVLLAVETGRGGLEGALHPRTEDTRADASNACKCSSPTSVCWDSRGSTPGAAMRCAPARCWGVLARAKRSCFTAPTASEVSHSPGRCHPSALASA